MFLDNWLCYFYLNVRFRFTVLYVRRKFDNRILSWPEIWCGFFIFLVGGRVKCGRRREWNSERRRRRRRVYEQFWSNSVSVLWLLSFDRWAKQQRLLFVSGGAFLEYLGLDHNMTKKPFWVKQRRIEGFYFYFFSFFLFNKRRHLCWA